MKKKLFIGTVLPTIAALGVIGSGFSLWIFSDSNSVTTSGTIGVTVTNVAKIGTLTVANTNTQLQLDQVKNDLNAKGTGPTFITNGDSALQKVTYTKDKTQEYYVDYQNGVTNITFTTTITVPSALAKYVTLGSSATYYGKEVTLGKVQATDSDNAVYTFTIDADTIYTNNGNTFDSTNGVEVFNWNLLTASYAKEPATLAEYTTMLTAVQDKEISVEYKAVISINK